MINLELFCCSGGMAEGFRRAGIEFDLAVDFDPNHCDSYQRNLGFPEGWFVAGATKKVRWGAIGMAMPPALAEAVARAIVEQDKATIDQASLALEAG